MKKTMKKLSRLFVGIFLSTLVLTSPGCKQRDAGGPDNEDRDHPVSFQLFASSVDNTQKSGNGLLDGLLTITPEMIAKVAIDIDSDPTVVQPFDIKTSAITTPIRLASGSHTLNRITLLDQDDVVIYSSVTSVAPLAAFVSNYTPVNFSVPRGATEYVNVDVIAVDDWTPDMFGYSAFAINVTTVQKVFFYGWTDDGQVSNMSCDVLKYGDIIYSGNNQGLNEFGVPKNGILTVCYSNEYDVDDATELITVNLVKDGVPMTRTFSVATLMTAPWNTELIYFNVNGGGTQGFEEAPPMFGIGLRVMSNQDGSEPNNSSYKVYKTDNTLVWDSGAATTGMVNVQYPDYSTPDADEFYRIEIVTQEFDYRSGGIPYFSSYSTHNATISVATLKATGSQSLRFRDNINPWLFN